MLRDRIDAQLAKWLTRETDEDPTDQVIACTRKCVVAPMDTRIALRAAEPRCEHKLAAADATVYAAARERNADVPTSGAHFGKLPGVAYFRKSA